MVPKILPFFCVLGMAQATQPNVIQQLYDRNADPMEHVNVNARNTPSAAILAKMEELDDHAPQVFAANVEVDHGNAPNKDKDTTIKPNRLIFD